MWGRAPVTFSMTYGLPVAIRMSRTTSMSSNSDDPCRFDMVLYDWQGGDAQMMSN